MTSAYLYLNAAIYLLLAVWCTLAPARTAAAVGYASLTRSGQTEYLTIYGGLQLGLAFLFAWFAWTQQMRTGLVLAMALYLGFSRDTRKNAPQNSNNSFVVMT